MRSFRFRWLLSGGLVLASFIACTALTSCHDPRGRSSPEDKKLASDYDAIRDEMSEGEVDKLMANYHPGQAREERDVDGGLRPLRRPAVLNKWYYVANGRGEDMLVAHVYFDKDGRVVGKFLNMLVK